jgi:hypothetical protein
MFAAFHGPSTLVVADNMNRLTRTQLDPDTTLPVATLDAPAVWLFSRPGVTPVAVNTMPNLYVFDPEDGSRLLLTLRNVRDLQFTADGAELRCVTDESIQRYTIADKGLQEEYPVGYGSMTALAWDGPLPVFFAARADSVLLAFNRTVRRPVDSVRTGFGAAKTLFFEPVREHLLARCDDNAIVCMRADTRLLPAPNADSAPDGDGFAIVGAWPQPAHGGLQVKLRGANRASVDVMLFDVLGRRVWSGGGIEPGGDGSVALATPPLPTGSYLLRVEHAGRAATRIIAFR